MRRRRSWSTWAIRSCSTCILPEEILVGPGIAPEEVEEIFVEA